MQFSGNKVTKDFQMEEITVSNPINQVMLSEDCLENWIWQERTTGHLDKSH